MAVQCDAFQLNAFQNDCPRDFIQCDAFQLDAFSNDCAVQPATPARLQRRVTLVVRLPGQRIHIIPFPEEERERGTRTQQLQEDEDFLLGLWD